MRIKYTREVMATLIVIVAIVALYYSFTPSLCGDYTCFEAHMSKCRPATYINEQDEASWQYEIKGSTRKMCEIEVTMLNVKDAGIELRDTEGDSMLCYYDIGVVGAPEKNLAACTGELKEGLQDIVIEKLYKYIVANLGEVRKELFV